MDENLTFGLFLLFSFLGSTPSKFTTEFELITNLEFLRLKKLSISTKNGCKTHLANANYRKILIKINKFILARKKINLKVWKRINCYDEGG